MSGRHGRDSLEVLRVEEVAGDERNRVCLVRRSKEFMPEVSKFCASTKQVSSQVDGLNSKNGTRVQISCDDLFEWVSVRDELACIVSDYYYEGVSIFREMDVFLIYSHSSFRHLRISHPCAI